MIWNWAALMPHPPIMVPEVGRGREEGAPHTLSGSKTLLDRLAASPDGGRPDFLLILSPHQPYAPGALLFNTAPALEGDLRRFGAPNINLRLTTASETLTALASYLTAAGLPVATAANPDLTPDHGTQVPLYFLRRIRPDLPPVILANPIGLAPPRALAMGQALAAFQPPAFKYSGALLASGDLSHRLTRDAPAGFHPDGAAFDRELLAALAAGNGADMPARWTSDRLANAGECGYLPALVLLGLAGEPVEVISYEGPFGVGYSHALWRPRAEAS
jgi:aromatic ring-opening dioxygenase LigB subunit